jgi:hypothetical protein
MLLLISLLFVKLRIELHNLEIMGRVAKRLLIHIPLIRQNHSHVATVENQISVSISDFY